LLPGLALVAGTASLALKINKPAIIGVTISLLWILLMGLLSTVLSHGMIKD
jgi:hypothetical protein